MSKKMDIEFFFSAVHYQLDSTSTTPTHTRIVVSINTRTVFGFTFYWRFKMNEMHLSATIKRWNANGCELSGFSEPISSHRNPNSHLIFLHIFNHFLHVFNFLSRSPFFCLGDLLLFHLILCVLIVFTKKKG